MAQVPLNTPDKKAVQIVAETDGLITLVIKNISGGNVYLERDSSKANNNDGYPLLNTENFPANNTWKGDLFASCDIQNGKIIVLKSAELKA